MVREHNFSPALKREVWRQQKNRCALCGEVCKGHFARRRGQVHHINPVAFGGPSTRVNAAGLCMPCHDRADKMAFEEGRLITE